jgi:3',5'-cyclic AMP phosphodiesterase CpdA
MKRLVLVIASVAIGIAAFAGKPLPKLVQGTVTDISGKPLEGVVVSDGFTVVRTDAEGKYCFPRIPAAYYVFVSVPAAYEVPLRQGLPCFFKKLEDRPAYDFVFKPLKNGPEKEFNLFLLADPQCQWVWHVRRLREEGIADVKAYARKCKGPDYAMTLGDIAYSEGHRNTNYLLPMIREEMSADKAGMPVFQTVGNHDFEYPLAAVEDGSPTISMRRDRIFEDNFGPANYSFNRGDVHIVSMNNVCFETFGYPGKYHGDFSDEQLAWFEQDLAAVPEDKLVILCVHIPFEGIVQNSPNVARIYDLLDKRSHARIVSGHTHTIKHIHYPNGVSEFVAGAMSGCWWWSKNCADGAPNGYAVWKIRGNEVVSDIYKGQNFKDDYQMRIYRGDSEFGGSFERFKLEHGSGCLLVNVWNWDEGWRSEVYEDGKLAGQLEKMPLSGEFEAPYNGSKDWWAIGYNVGVVGRGHIQGSTRNNYCSKNYHMFKYVLKDPAAKIKVEVFDNSGRKFSCSKITTAEDYATLAERPKYPVEPSWEE